MRARILTTTGLVAALALAPAARVQADAADFIGGALIGGVIGHALANQGNRTTTVVVPGQQGAVRPGIPVTEQGRETQLALNYFGFNAGAVDGQVGNGTRAAIERYQGAMGFPVNGRDFSDYQFAYLMDAYYWAQNGGAMQSGLAGQPLLLAYRDQREGRTLPAAAPQPIPTQPPATTIIVNPAPVAPVPVPVATPAPAVPNLFGNGAPGLSLANACNATMLQSSTNGGMVTLATMSDPAVALSEQFCVARSYATARGEELMRGIAGLSPAEIAEQCGQFAAMLAPQVARLGTTGHSEVTPQVAAIAATSGVPLGDLAATARVCLSVGYTQDNMGMALGAATMLVALGEPVYAELVGHHVREGFGAPVRPDLALGWYNTALTALERGAQPAFMPGQPDRALLLRLATQRLQGQAAVAPVPAAVPAAQTGAFPTFRVNQ